MTVVRSGQRPRNCSRRPCFAAPLGSRSRRRSIAASERTRIGAPLPIAPTPDRLRARPAQVAARTAANHRWHKIGTMRRAAGPLRRRRFSGLAKARTGRTEARRALQRVRSIAQKMGSCVLPATSYELLVAVTDRRVDSVRYQFIILNFRVLRWLVIMEQIAPTQACPCPSGMNLLADPGRL